MAETPRTIATLLTDLFRDGQDEGSINPQDMRDLIVSLIPSIGAIFFSTPVETIISMQGEKVLALGTTTLTTTPHDIDMPQNNRIRYTGTVAKHFVIDAAISSISAGNNKNIEYQIFKNGSPLIETLMGRAHGTGSAAGAIPLTTNVDMEPNDFLELFVSNESDDTNITIKNGTINMIGFAVE